MLALLAATLCSAVIALLFKYSETRNHNRYAVTSANYLVAWLVGLLTLLQSQGLPGISLSSDNLKAILAAIGKGTKIEATEAVLLWALLLGVVAGFLMCTGFLLFQVAIRRHGAGLSGAFAKLGILVPMVLSLVFWREYPALLQWLGLLLALAAVIVVIQPGAAKGRAGLLLPLVLLLVGCAEFSNKAYQFYGAPEWKSLFLTSAFFFAFVFSMIALALRKGKTGPRDLFLGAMVGVPNLACSWFLILALEQLPAALVFPIFSAGATILISLGAAVWMGERFSKRDKLAVALVLPALILINL